MTAAHRNIDDLPDDLADVIDAAAVLVSIGKERPDAERPMPLE